MRNRSGKIGLTTRGGFAVLLWSLAAGAALLGATCDAQAIDLTQPGDTAGIKVDVPKDKVIVGGMQRGGFYWVAKPLMEEYDKLRARVQALARKLSVAKSAARRRPAKSAHCRQSSGQFES